MNSKTEVDQLNVVSIINNDILKLEIPMDDGVLVLICHVQIFKTFAQLLYEEAGLICRNRLLSFVSHVLVK